MFIYSKNEWCIGLFWIEWDFYYSLILVELLTITVYKEKVEDNNGVIKKMNISENSKKKQVNGQKEKRQKHKQWSIIHSNMTSFKRFGSKPVVKYSYIGISADRQRHNLFWLFKYRIFPIRI